jgi:hypothetical protein
MIYVSGLLSWTAISGGTGDFRITNLPFTILSFRPVRIHKSFPPITAALRSEQMTPHLAVSVLLMQRI